MIHSTASSEDPGHVLESGDSAPLLSPLVRFFCIILSFEMKCVAVSMGYEWASECKWGSIEGRRANDGSGGEDT